MDERRLGGRRLMIELRRKKGGGKELGRTERGLTDAFEGDSCVY